ncbi:similar to Saccharomyces cerevisiae YGR280C PXR1 Essential protein involved in rRNA and snoRNA maturation [Geotrichum candidum]|uniref:Protein PXR1 n=1 Tax=Geotrichum candidum TaxID=1173061 RepID=A0A0J9X616_GEOCN|nr:similar to Saccharomyces cerevisiae YGR280C PXR1 Essential protein involved in rRNA and snoRNA maturation [Geotrichum candidum]
MGLAGAKQNTKISKDPRNTHWSNNKSRFGHKHLEQLGWKPGNGLGVTQAGNTVHVKVSFKKDNTGLGHKTRSSSKKNSEGDDIAEFAQGLDTFQRILGRLNGKDSNKVDAALGSRRVNMVMEMGKFGMHFVYGGLLEGTVEKMVDEIKTGKKRSHDEEVASESSDSEEEPVKKKSKKSKSDDKKKEKKSKKEKKEKKDKKEKKEKKEKKDKKEKKEKKEKSKDKKKSSKSKSDDSSASSSTASSGTSTPRAQPILRGMQGTRARWIAQKRAATMDAKSLAEILMVTS